jgi:hypothetical protein
MARAVLNPTLAGKLFEFFLSISRSSFICLFVFSLFALRISGDARFASPVGRQSIIFAKILKGDNQKRMILPKNLKIEINIDSS